jgi:hypothetical protein
LLAREQGSRATEARGHFVADEEDAVLVAQPARLGEVGGRIEIETASALQQRLAGEGGDLVRVLAQGHGQRGESLVDRAPDLAPPIAHALGRRHEVLLGR